MSEGSIIETIQLIIKQGHALVVVMKIFGVERTTFHVEIITSCGFKSSTWFSNKLIMENG